MQEKTVATTMRLPERVLRQLKSKCALEGRTMQDVIFNLVKSYLEENVQETDKGNTRS